VEWEDVWEENPPRVALCVVVTDWLSVWLTPSAWASPVAFVVELNEEDEEKPPTEWASVAARPAVACRSVEPLTPVPGIPALAPTDPPPVTEPLAVRALDWLQLEPEAEPLPDVWAVLFDVLST
jgi:hypothetical protein